MDISKVVYGDTTLIDLTEDTVTADSMLSGVTAHGANGEQIYGTMSQVTPATATPLMDGTAAVGTSIKYAREDHVHPHDSSIPTKTSDLTNDSGFITSYTETDPVFTASEKVQFAVVEANENIVIINSSGDPASYDDIINAYKKSKGIIIAFLDGGDVSDGWLAQLTSYNDTTSTIKMQSFSTYNELLVTATENNGAMIVTDMIQRPMECIEDPGNSSDGDILVYNGTSNTWISAASSSINIKSDWEEDDSTDPAYIQNKPAIKTGTGTNAVILNDVENNVASGNYSITAGRRNKNTGSASLVTGLGNDSIASRSITTGQLNRNDGGYNLVVGNGSYANASNGVSVGGGASRNITISGAANATTYTYTELPSFFNHALTRQLMVVKTSTPYAIALVTLIDTTNNTITLDRTLSETALTNESVGLLIAHNLNNTFSMIVGQSLQTTRNNQMIVGQFNELDSDALFIVGNGDYDLGASNALAVHEDGSAWFAGTVSAGTAQTPATISANNDLTTKAYVDNKVGAITASDIGAVAAPSSANTDEVIAYNGTTWVASKRMVILSYGSSTWTDFINAYNSNAVVYCKASSNSNPASGAQTRMAFMAYVNSATPTNVEFQYYRSVSSHSDSQQGDQVFIYKLDKTAGWSVTTRNSFTKIAVGAGLSSSYASQTLTITNTQTGLPAVTSSDNGKVLRVVSGEWAAVELPSASGVSF